MTTRERILTEIERIPEAELEELYALIQDFLKRAQEQHRPPGVLSRLKHIRIEAPEDFATNLVQYLNR